MEWLCWLLGALLLITLLGHGIWVFIATLLKSAKPKAAARWIADSTDEHARTQMQVTRLLDAGLIDLATHQRVITALDTLRHRRMPPPVPVLPMPAIEDRPTSASSVEPQSLGAPAHAETFADSVSAAPSGLSQAVSAAHSIPELMAAHAVQNPVASRPPAAPIIPRPPRRSFSEVFASFLRESNIRWGELIGGLLIIGCSIALVISFWNQIADKPFFQFGIFTGVTAATLALGLYAEHRWKLPTTSRGILLIATLLVPLNFLAFAALSQGRIASLLVAGSEVAALALFGFLVFRAARVLSPYWPKVLTAGVVGASASLLITKNLSPISSFPRLLALASIPIIAYGAPIGLVLWRASRWKQIRRHVAEAIFLLLGVLTFAAGLAISLILFQGDSPWQTSHDLAPLLSLAAIPSLATGLLMWRKVTDKRLAKTRTAGTALAVAAAFLMLSTIALAWPDPASMLPLAAIDFGVLTAIAIFFDIPAAHLLAAPCLLLAYLLGFEVAFRHIGWTATPAEMIRALIAAGNGPALMPLFLLTGAAAWLLSRRRTTDSKIYAWIPVGVAAISIGLASQDFGRPGDPHGVAWVYLAYAIVALSLSAWSRRRGADWAGCGLLLAACLQFFVTRTSVAHPWPTALLAYATLAAVGILVSKRGTGRFSAWGISARWTATGASAVAAAILLATLSFDTAGDISWRLLWVSGLWFVIAIVEDSIAIFSAAQVALVLAAALGTVARLAHQPWFAASPWQIRVPRTLQSVGVVLAWIAAGFLLAGVVLPKKWAATRWLGKPWSVGRILSFALAGELAVLVLAGIFPALQIEFAITRRPAFEPWAAQAVGGWSWALWAILLVIFAASTLRRNQSALNILLALVALACPLWAARWADAGASASALRWSLAVYLAAVSMALVLRQRMPRPIATLLNPAGVTREIELFLTALAALPILALSIYPAALTLSGWHVAGPSPHCFFGAIGNSLSYVVPLAVVALVFIGYAVRERSAGWAAAASAVCNLTVTLGYALGVLTAGQQLDVTHVVRLIQLNALTIGLFTIAWQAVRALDQQTSQPARPAPLLLKIEIALALAGNFLLIAPATLHLIALPGQNSTAIAMVGDPLGWLSLGCTFAVMFWTRGIRREQLSTGAVVSAIVAVALMAALSAGQWDQSNWLSFHVLMLATIAAAGGIIGLGVWIGKSRRGWAEAAVVQGNVAGVTASPPIALQYERRDQTTGPPVQGNVYVDGQELRPAFRGWTAALSGFALLLALRAMVGDPQGPWWSVGTTATLSLLWTSLACWLAVPSLLYVSGLLLNLSASMWWVAAPSAKRFGLPKDLMAVNVAVLAIFGLAALVLKLNVFDKSQRIKRPIAIPFHRAAAIVCVLCVTLLATTHGTALINWGALAATILLALAMLWDSDSRLATLQLYVLGLAATARMLNSFNLSNEMLEAGVAIALSGYVILTGILGGMRDELLRAADRVGTPLPLNRNSLDWLALANFILALAATNLAIACDFTLDFTPLRIGVASAAVFQIIGLVAIARSDRRLGTRDIALCVLALATVAWGWAWMPADRSWLDWWVVMMVCLEFTTIGYALVGHRWRTKDSLWSAAARTVGGPVAFACAASLVGILSLEVVDRINPGLVQMHWLSILAMLLTILGAAVGSLIVALKPDQNPLSLPESARGIYVYACELLLTLAFLHLRLTMPRLFGGAFSQYWPLVVMALAFGGVALGELFRRRGNGVLASPLFRTGIFLPLLPVLAFWMAPSRVDLSALLFTAGVFYAIVSVTRKSFVFGVVAALAGNGALWSLLYHRPEFSFLLHPQLWVIPAAVSVLIAAQLNRDRLSPSQLRFVRYCCLMLAYVSSTADIFLNGVHDHPWLPLVLAALSVAGVMTGILFRLRSFLFLGTAFLTLAIVTMIYYASANLHWTWLWYVAGIALGAAIIVIFALFEKKRAEMLSLVEGLKGWQ
jgi:hypothetical protein